MKHTLPPLGDLFDEASLLMRQNFRELSKLILPRGILPLFVIALTCALATAVDEHVLVLFLFEVPVAVVLALQMYPRLLELTLATVEGRDINADAAGAWPVLGSALLWTGPQVVLTSLVKVLLGVGIQSLVRVLLLYPSIRFSFSTFVTVADGVVLEAPIRSWRLTEGVVLRLWMYRIVLLLPALLLTALLGLILILTMLSNVHPLNREALKLNAPLILGAVAFAVLPMLAYVCFFLTYVDALMYVALIEQEEPTPEEMEAAAPTA